MSVCLKSHLFIRTSGYPVHVTSWLPVPTTGLCLSADSLFSNPHNCLASLLYILVAFPHNYLAYPHIHFTYCLPYPNNCLACPDFTMLVYYKRCITSLTLHLNCLTCPSITCCPLGASMSQLVSVLAQGNDSGVCHKSLILSPIHADLLSSSWVTCFPQALLGLLAPFCWLLRYK